MRSRPWRSCGRRVLWLMVDAVLSAPAGEAEEHVVKAWLLQLDGPDRHPARVEAPHRLRRRARVGHREADLAGGGVDQWLVAGGEAGERRRGGGGARGV